MSIALIRVARISAPFANGTPIGVCVCGNIVHEHETHLVLPDSTVLCPACTIDHLQLSLFQDTEKFAIEALHVVEPTYPIIEQYYATLGDATIQ